MKIKRLLSIFLLLICISGILSNIWAAGINLDNFNFHIGTGEISSNPPGEEKKVSEGAPGITYSGDKIDKETTSAWRALYDKYKTLINLIYTFMILTCLGGFIISIMKLGSSGGNPQQRQMAMMGLLFCGIGVALLGSAGLWFRLSMTML